MVQTKKTYDSLLPFCPGSLRVHAGFLQTNQEQKTIRIWTEMVTHSLDNFGDCHPASSALNGPKEIRKLDFS